MKKLLISVCICTYKRKDLLARLLDSLIDQKIDERFSFDVVIIDNDKYRTGEDVVRQFQIHTNVKVTYDCEPEQNISRARNRAVKDAPGDLIAFIDDDETPDPRWLWMLFDTHRKFQVDGVLGPVIPVYDGIPPKWLIESGLCNRDSFPTGTILDSSKFMRTGNVLFSRHIIKELETPFDPELGLTGGEDVDFFKRMLNKGNTFIWCDEAAVFEFVPKERQRIVYHVKRALLRGLTNSRREYLVSKETLKSVAAVMSYTFCLPILMVVSRPLFLIYLIKNCDHLGKLLGYLGIKLIKKRSF